MDRDSTGLPLSSVQGSCSLSDSTFSKADSWTDGGTPCFSRYGTLKLAPGWEDNYQTAMTHCCGNGRRKRSGSLTGNGTRILGTDGHFIILQFRPRNAAQIPIRLSVAHFKFLPARDRGGLGQTGTVVIDADVDVYGNLSASRRAATG